MTNEQLILGIMKEQGRTDALDLRNRAKDMDATAIIAEDSKIPLFEEGKDYSSWPTGSPIGQIVDGELYVFTMITPVNTANYPGITPYTERSLYSLCHTKDPAKAKPFLPSLGTSGMWMIDEVCTKDGHVWKSLKNDHSFAPNEVGTTDYWEDLGEISLYQ